LKIPEIDLANDAAQSDGMNKKAKAKPKRQRAPKPDDWPAAADQNARFLHVARSRIARRRRLGAGRRFRSLPFKIRRNPQVQFNIDRNPKISADCGGQIVPPGTRELSLS